MLARLASSLVFFALLLYGLFSSGEIGGLIILGLTMLGTSVGTYEYYQMARKLGVKPTHWAGAAIAIAFLVDAYFFRCRDTLSLIVICFWILLITQVLLKKIEGALVNTAVSLFGSIYVGLPLALVIYIFRHAETKWGFTEPHAGSLLLLFLILTSWATDIGGYCIGKPFGKHKMSPVLSPNKSVEGLIGGAVLAIVSGALLKLFWPGMEKIFTWPEAIFLPVLFTLVGTVGDLGESAFKRDSGVKDSGKTFTGHGGMLDIIDSLLLCAPVFYLYLNLTNTLENQSLKEAVQSLFSR